MIAKNSMNHSSPSEELIHIAKRGVIFGQFQLADLREKIGTGEVLRTDHYWKQGMQGWLLVGLTFEIVSAEIRTTPPVLPISAPSPPALPPALPPAAPGARPGSGGIQKLFYLTPMFIVGALIALIVLLQGYAYVTLKAPLASALLSDSRNRGIKASACFQYGLPGGSIVLDIDSIGPGTKTVDMLRVMLQFAETQKYSSYDRVILSCRGRERFQMKGAYFKTLGQEYGSQNPIYTMRTLPENLYRMDGSRAYPVWEGGVLGVMSAQMGNFSEFTTEWLR